MWSGKSASLQRELRRAAAGGLSTVLVRPSLDTRTEEATTHDGLVMASVVLDDLYSVVPVRGFDVVAVDEAQFFGKELLDFCAALAADGVRVVVGGLDADSNQDTFGHIHRLLPIADTFVKLSAVCVRCGCDAPFSTRNDSSSAGGVCVGGAETYRASCRRCLRTE